MRTLKVLWIAGTAAMLMAGCAARAPGMEATSSQPLGIGRAATVQEMRGWDIDVRPDGTGLPAGSGSVALGKTVYDAKCAACHGADGKGATAPALAGGVGSLGSGKPVRTIGSFWPYATTVYDYIYRAMPWDKPMSLTSDEVYGVTAYLLSRDKIVPDNAVLDAKSLAAVRMPNRAGFKPSDDRARLSGNRCMRGC